MIKENHKSWYEDESWEALNLPYECFQKILKGKVHKAMNGAIAGKYSNWPGVKEFVQKHTYGSNGHCIKFNDLYRYLYCCGLEGLGQFFICFHDLYHGDQSKSPEHSYMFYNGCYWPPQS